MLVRALQNGKRLSTNVINTMRANGSTNISGPHPRSHSVVHAPTRVSTDASTPNPIACADGLFYGLKQAKGWAIGLGASEDPFFDCIHGGWDRLEPSCRRAHIQSTRIHVTAM